MLWYEQILPLLSTILLTEQKRFIFWIKTYAAMLIYHLGTNVCLVCGCRDYSLISSMIYYPAAVVILWQVCCRLSIWITKVRNSKGMGSQRVIWEGENRHGCLGPSNKIFYNGSSEGWEQSSYVNASAINLKTWKTCKHLIRYLQHYANLKDENCTADIPLVTTLKENNTYSPNSYC